MPQRVELKVQSGVAPGWLAFGSIKWTDWSVLDSSTTLIEAARWPAFSTTRLFFNDGWTVTGGVGHRFSESISGVAVADLGPGRIDRLKTR